MALAITRILCSSSWRSKLVPKVSRQPYPCYILTDPNGKHSITTSSTPVPLLFKEKYINHQFYEIRQFSTSGSEKSTEKNGDSPKAEKLSLFQRFKQMYRDYWYVLVPVHLVTSAAWFGGFYYLASSGFDIPAMLECMNFNERIVNSMRNSSMGYVAITYGLYKIATPARYAVTLGGTTISIQYLKKWGYIKPMPSKERMKEIYEETKEGIKEKSEHLLDSVQSIKETVKETKEGLKDKKDNIVSSVKDSVKDSKHSITKKIIRNTGHTTQDKPIEK